MTVTMPPRANKKLGIQSGQDRDGIYQALCIELADDYGFTRGQICWEWSQLALMREFECKQSRAVAEDGAWHDVQRCFLKYGDPD